MQRSLNAVLFPGIKTKNTLVLNRNLLQVQDLFVALRYFVCAEEEPMQDPGANANAYASLVVKVFL